MKKQLCLILLFCLVLLKAQDNFILYNKITDDTGQTKASQNYLLSYKNNSSIFCFYKDDIAKDLKSFLSENIPLRGSEIIRNTGKNFEIRSTGFTKEPLYTIDNYQDFNWVISKKDVKDIMGYKCFKATGKFRGRTYIAWFTPDLPNDIGPWKFRGLPGIILSISDTDNIFTFQAIEIHLNAINKFPISERVNFDKNQNYISYKDFINKENSHINDMRKRIEANRSTGTVVLSRSNNRDFKIEKSFEWENAK
ncbi:GLPGLI family protein [Chryseobacterium sp. NEB161]|nr:GLPGLI family protein [Chryseobacterium sp. NEB161]